MKEEPKVNDSDFIGETNFIAKYEKSKNESSFISKKSNDASFNITKQNNTTNNPHNSKNSILEEGNQTRSTEFSFTYGNSQSTITRDRKLCIIMMIKSFSIDKYKESLAYAIKKINTMDPMSLIFDDLGESYEKTEEEGVYNIHFLDPVKTKKNICEKKRNLRANHAINSTLVLYKNNDARSIFSFQEVQDNRGVYSTLAETIDNNLAQMYLLTKGGTLIIKVEGLTIITDMSIVALTIKRKGHKAFASEGTICIEDSGSIIELSNMKNTPIRVYVSTSAINN